MLALKIFYLNDQNFEKKLHPQLMTNFCSIILLVLYDGLVLK